MQNKQDYLLLKALRGEHVDRPPVWMMRQAGRYLPEYMELRRQYDFFTRVETPELATEITLQPIRRFQPDAAILFSDILVIPKAMGMEVQLVEKKGPVLPNPIKGKEDLAQLDVAEAHLKLDHVYQAIKLCRKELNQQTPLIGFSGAPWTLLCYMIEGQGSKTFSKAKSWCFTYPDMAHELLDKLTTVIIKYLKNQVEAGAEVIKIFDSWSGLLSPADFKILCEPYINKILDAMKGSVPTIVFAKGSWYALSSLSESSCSAIAIDWTIEPHIAREQTKNKKTLQGNFDPSKLLMPREEIIKQTTKMISDFGTQKYIVNLGHGITPDVPVDHAKAFFDTVKSYQS